jgi:paraquat-inducible protein A
MGESDVSAKSCGLQCPRAIERPAKPVGASLHTLVRFLRCESGAWMWRHPVGVSMLIGMIRPPQVKARGSGDTSSVIVCHACDLAHRRGPIEGKARVRCVRCGAELYRTNSASVDTAIALAVTAAALLLLSNAFPLVALQLNGSTRSATLLGAAYGLYSQGYGVIAALVLLTTVLVPLFQVTSLLYVLVPLRSRRHARGQNALFRALTRLRPWAMPEVFMLGALVALVKLAAMAEVIPGIALFSYGAMMLTLAALTNLMPTEQFWRWIENPA